MDCKMSNSKKCKEGREAHKEVVRLQNKAYYESHKAERRAYRDSKKEDFKVYRKLHASANKKKYKTYYEANREEIIVASKAYSESNKEKVRATKKAYYESHKEEIKEYQEKYRKHHKKERRIYANSRRKSDLNYKISCALRTRLRMAIHNNQKAGSAVRDLGCSISELKIHLESKFQPGMSWENWSFIGWHVDHIKPLSSFDLSKREEFLKANHFSNLQPMWADENLKKHTEVIDGIF
jgi:hypothetical protein